MGKKSRGNGEGSVYKLPNGKWKAIVTVGYTSDGKRKTKSKIFDKKKDALSSIQKLKHQMEYSDMTFAQVWEIVGPQLQLSDGKRKEYDRAWGRLKWLHDRKPAEIKTADLQFALDNVQGGYHPKKACKNVLGHIYKFCMANDIVNKNYVAFVELPGVPEVLQDAFTDEDLDRVWKHVAMDEVARWIIIMAYCGLRPGELRAIRVQDVHLDEQFMVGGIKTKKGRNRTIPIADKVVPVLRLQMLGNQGLLVTCCKDHFYDQYNEFVDRIGIKHLPARFCRHTFATRSAEKEIPPAVIQEIMGHTKYQTTLGYTHIRTEKKVQSVNKL